MIHDMSSFIFPNFRIITTLAIASLMVIGENIYCVKFARSLSKETPISVSPLENIIPIRGQVPRRWDKIGQVSPLLGSILTLGARSRLNPTEVLGRETQTELHPLSPTPTKALPAGSLVNATLNSNVVAQLIRGSSGGPVNSVNCGFIANSPNYTINLTERVDYMRITVQAVGGQPTLLVVGPQANDSFCVLGDRGAGLQPEISGVWEPGTYNIFIGDRTGTQHKFTLNISRSK